MPGLILAKIHMVTKHKIGSVLSLLSLILAKIHMVTKPRYDIVPDFGIQH